jgi:hypothetical protein
VSKSSLIRLSEAERDRLRRIVEEEAAKTRGGISGLSRKMGLGPNTIYVWLRKDSKHSIRNLPAALNRIGRDISEIRAGGIRNSRYFAGIIACLRDLKENGPGEYSRCQRLLFESYLYFSSHGLDCALMLQPRRIDNNGVIIMLTEEFCYDLRFTFKDLDTHFALFRRLPNGLQLDMSGICDRSSFLSIVERLKGIKKEIELASKIGVDIEEAAKKFAALSEK